jgi:hypothetical protein
MLKKPSLGLDVGHIRSVESQFIDDHVLYVHGSNSESLKGVAKFRALLPMDLIERTPWFHGSGLASGERGYTLEGLYESDSPFSVVARIAWSKVDSRWVHDKIPVHRQEIQQVSSGVSISYSQNYQISRIYSNFGSNGHIYPIMYGIYLKGDDVLHPYGLDHPISKGAITIDCIRAIYVPPGRREQTSEFLRRNRMERLSLIVKEGRMF